MNGADARTVRPYMPLACKSSRHLANPKGQSSMVKVQRQLIIKVKVQWSKFKVKSLKAQSSNFNVQSQSPYIPFSAMLHANAGSPPKEGLGESPLSHLFLKLLSLLLNERGIVEVVYLHGFSHPVHGL